MTPIPAETAAAYLDAGLSVLPAMKARKRPAVGAWKTWSQRLPTDIEVEAWFSNGHEALCVVAGAVSGNLECIDFDQKAEAYPAWCAKIDGSLLSALVVERTPSGGKHVVYRCAGTVEGNQKLAQGIRDGKIATLVETRGEAGLFLCAPSPGYTLEQGDFTHIPTIPQEAREALLSAARELDEHPAVQERGSAPAPLVAAPAPTTAGFLTRPGDDFASRGDPRPYLQAHGWTLYGTKSDGNELWTRPGKDPRLGHSATLKDGVFFVFSSNAAPFEPNRGYIAYPVFALLEHANDVKAATDEAGLQAALDSYKAKIEALFTMSDDVKNAYTVIGSINGTEWNEDFAMTETDGVWKTNEAYELHAGEEFKVRQGLSWDVCFPAENYKVETDGTYYIVLNGEEVSLEPAA